MPSWWQHSLALCRAPANELAFAARCALGWSRGPAVLPHEPKPADGDLAGAAARRAADLAARYDLTALQARSTRLVHAENVALLDRLEALFADLPVPTGPVGVVRAIDVGSGNFAYATALHRFLARHRGGPRPVQLLGVEVDGHGIYRDGHSRADHARAHAALAGPEVRFAVADFARCHWPEQDLVSLFYPFLSVYPLLRWGLPLSRFRPRRLLRRAVASLRPGGLLVVANQTGEEAARLEALLAGEAVERVAAASFATDLVPYAARTADRVASVWRRRPGLPVGRASG